MCGQNCVTSPKLEGSLSGSDRECEVTGHVGYFLCCQTVLHAQQIDVVVVCYRLTQLAGKLQVHSSCLLVENKLFVAAMSAAVMPCFAEDEGRLLVKCVNTLIQAGRTTFGQLFRIFNLNEPGLLYRP